MLSKSWFSLFSALSLSPAHSRLSFCLAEAVIRVLMLSGAAPSLSSDKKIAIYHSISTMARRWNLLSVRRQKEQLLIAICKSVMFKWKIPNLGKKKCVLVRKREAGRVVLSGFDEHFVWNIHRWNVEREWWQKSVHDSTCALFCVRTDRDDKNASWCNNVNHQQEKKRGTATTKKCTRIHEMLQINRMLYATECVCVSDS